MAANSLSVVLYRFCASEKDIEAYAMTSYPALFFCIKHAPAPVLDASTYNSILFAVGL